MKILCDSCEGPAIETITHIPDGVAAQTDTQVIDKQALLVCSQCLDKIPNDVVVKFFSHLTVEKGLIRQPPTAEQ